MGQDQVASRWHRADQPGHDPVGVVAISDGVHDRDQHDRYRLGEVQDPRCLVQGRLRIAQVGVQVVDEAVVMAGHQGPGVGQHDRVVVHIDAPGQPGAADWATSWVLFAVGVPVPMSRTAGFPPGRPGAPLRGRGTPGWPCPPWPRPDRRRRPPRRPCGRRRSCPCRPASSYRSSLVSNAGVKGGVIVSGARSAARSALAPSAAGNHAAQGSPQQRDTLWTCRGLLEPRRSCTAAALLR